MKKIVFWFLTAFFIISCLAFSPSISSVLFLIIAVVIIPIDKINILVNRFIPNRKIKIACIIIIAIVGMIIAPTDPITEPDSSNETLQQNIVTENTVEEDVTTDLDQVAEKTTNDINVIIPPETQEEIIPTQEDSSLNSSLGEEFLNVENFIKNYNEIAIIPITDVMKIDIQSDEYYRTEFRLNAFQNAPAVKASIGNSTIEIINTNYGSWFGSDLRIYVNADSVESVKSIFEYFCKACDDLKQKDFDEFYKYYSLDSYATSFVIGSIDGYVAGLTIMLDASPEYFE